MHKLVRLVALLCALGALTAGTASAANWRAGNNGTYSMLATTAVQLKINGTTTIACTAMTIAGTFNAAPPLGTDPWLGYASVTPTFAACTLAGIATRLNCGAGQLDTGPGATAYAGPVVAPADLGTTSSTLSGFTCTVVIAGVNCSTITGFATSIYTNPSNLARTNGDLSISFVGQTFNAARIGAGCATVPDGRTVLSNGSGGGVLLRENAPVGPANQPYIFFA